MTPTSFGLDVSATSRLSPDDALLKLKKAVLSEQYKPFVEEWFAKQADWEPYRQDYLRRCLG